MQPLAPLSPTERTRVRRYRDRAQTDRQELYDTLDAALMCFLGVVLDGTPRVTPMAFGRVDDVLYLHGSPKTQALEAAAMGGEVCVTVCNVYGLVLANTMFHHSLNFRCAMIFGETRVVTDERERLAGLRAAVEHLVPGRGDALPDPSDKQLAITMVLALPLAEASVKVRQGPPGADPEDYETDIWGGVLPLIQTWGQPVPDPKLHSPYPVPTHVSRLVGKDAYGRHERDSFA